ncbi:MAG: glycosyltransferase [Alphaproteobacteria bacterium]
MPALSSRKRALRELVDRLAGRYDRWRRRNRYFYAEDARYMRFLVPEGVSVLELGCGAGDLLAALKPERGVGVDFSEPMLALARARHPGLGFHLGDVEALDRVAGLDGTYDAIVLSDTIGALDDCLSTLKQLHAFSHRNTRVVVSYYSRAWGPIFRLAAWLRLKQPSRQQNWLSTDDIANLLDLADFEVIKREWRVLSPRHMFGLGRLINRFVATLPGIRRLCLRNHIVARPRPRQPLGGLSATVLIPCRNERGNVEPAVTRLPRFCDDIEVLFVEGHSKDGTWDEIQRVIAAYPDMDIKALRQPGKGKGDAVRAGFAAARGDVLMILDADLTMPPEDLPKYYEALASGKGEFVNGSRLVYPMQHQAMRTLNLIANHIFSMLFTYLLNQRYTDTLCGTKVLLRADYLRIAANRSYFGDFDPFGDFDLIFGASKLNLKTAEVPIRYAARDYGETQISRFRHGWLLLRMVCFAFMKLKAL